LAKNLKISNFRPENTLFSYPYILKSICFSLFIFLTVIDMGLGMLCMNCHQLDIKTEEIMQNRQKEVEKRKNLHTPQNLPSFWCTRCTRTIYHKINFFADSESKFISRKSQRTPISSDKFCILGVWEYREGGGVIPHTPLPGIGLRWVSCRSWCSEYFLRPMWKVSHPLGTKRINNNRI